MDISILILNFNFWRIHKSYFKVGQNVISKWGSFDNFLFQSGASITSKWGRDSYFKVGQCYFKVGQKLFQSGAKCYFKVGQLRKSFISKWGKGYFKER